MAQSFENFNPNVIKKEVVKKNELPRKSSEIRSRLTLSERKKFAEMTPNEEMFPKSFTVWIIRTQWSQGYQLDVPDASAIQKKINPELNEDEYKNSDIRFVRVESVRQGDLRYELSSVFRDLGKISTNLIPDLVVLYGGEGYSDNQPDGDISLSARASEVNSIRDIRDAANSTLNIFPELVGDPIRDGSAIQFFADDILGGARSNTLLQEGDATQLQALQYAVSHTPWYGRNEKRMSVLFDEYCRTNDETVLRKIITPGRIAQALKDAQKMQPEDFDESSNRARYSSRTSMNPISQKEFLKRKQQLVALVSAFSTEESSETFQEDFFQEFKLLVDNKKAEYLEEVEQDAAEQRLIQPFIVSVGKSFKYRNASLSAGADAILPTLSSHEMETLISFVNRIRTSQASITRERMRRNKNDFYSTVVDQIDERSEQTADTEKELLLLSSLFERVSAKKILDVGSGFGRLALPLAQKGYSVTGIDANPKLLKRAKESIRKQKNLRYKKGDIVEYKNTIECGSYDAVYYGWHSFLEAYGLGNALSSLRSAYEALRPGGVVTFDQPSRENPGFQDGWYGDADHGYIAYLMDDEELQLLLRLAGFENTKILHWTTKTSELYPDGMKKVSVVAQKPTLPETFTE